MEMEGLFEGNEVLLYFISVLYILVNSSFSKNQKIISIYIFSYCLRLFNIMSLKIILTIISIVTFLYMEFLTSDEVKNKILTNLWDKLKDYIYKTVFEFSGLYFFISMLFLSKTMAVNLPIINYFNINIPFLQTEINVISFVFLAIAINNISSCKYSTQSFSNIREKMNKVSTWQTTNIAKGDKKKMAILVDIEDKSFFIRKNTYNFVSIEFLRYKIGRKKNDGFLKLKQNELTIDVIKRILFKKIYIKEEIGKIKKLLLKEIYIMEFIRKIRRYMRGYSTIEMQLIRTLGIKDGYAYVIYRKIYEIIYTKLFFKNIRKEMNKYYYDTKGCGTFKEYLLNIYIHIAPIRINKKDYKNMLTIWGAKSLKDVSKEQFFISILGLSHRNLRDDIFITYENIIQKHKLDKKEIRRLMEQVR